MPFLYFVNLPLYSQPNHYTPTQNIYASTKCRSIQILFGIVPAELGMYQFFLLSPT